MQDICDTAGATSDDCNLDEIPDECQLDCDNSGVPDNCEAPVVAVPLFENTSPVIAPLILQDYAPLAQDIHFSSSVVLREFDVSYENIGFARTLEGKYVLTDEVKAIKKSTSSNVNKTPNI